MNRLADLPVLRTGVFGSRDTNEQTSAQVLAAASVWSIVSAVIVFVLLQRFIVGALMAGATNANPMSSRSFGE